MLLTLVSISFLTVIIKSRPQLLIINKEPKNLTITRMEDPESETEESSPPLQDTCIQEVTSLFPDICLEYVKTIAGPLSFVPHEVINHLLDLQESGQVYQKAKRPKQAIGKRKRTAEGQDDEDEDEAEKLQNRLSEAKRKYSNLEGQVIAPRSAQMSTLKQMIAGDFPLVPVKVIQQTLSENGNRLFPTFNVINTALNEASDHRPLPWKLKKTPSVPVPRYKKERIDASIQACSNDWEKELMKELEAARLLQFDVAEKRRAEALAEEAERMNLESADARGEVTECGCCLVDTPWNRLVYCQGEDPHSFCTNCARRHAETQIGLSKYELECMSMVGCTAGFSYSERQKFLNKKLTAAIDRIEQEANLRMAKLPDLANCPFCHYAEEYPPVDVDREFRCRNDDCKITSCRLCNYETHIPKTCQEAAIVRGVDLRREVEEAMSRALIRTCNKCSTPFIKEEGCNKMTCTRKGCGNVQCYVCSKSCDYNHFNDESRGGKQGNCPLFESAEERHENEVNAAEKAAKQKLLEENPELAAAPELLNFNMSDRVKTDDMRRKSRFGHRFRDRADVIPVPPNPPLEGQRPFVDVPQPQPQQQLPQALQGLAHGGNLFRQENHLLREAHGQAHRGIRYHLKNAFDRLGNRVAPPAPVPQAQHMAGIPIQAQQQQQPQVGAFPVAPGDPGLAIPGLPPFNLQGAGSDDWT
ncbi:RING finger (TRIAD) [Fusarium agapanthi]|uniref:RING finger (TRIAD) n=1 Tax=Fusarium agapanthi TaxID=1803897 RepID=A0A9P5B7R5_9HYPO|nr:RING finger (TRIAD) [Fusarium agapanthi]